MNGLTSHSTGICSVLPFKNVWCGKTPQKKAVVSPYDVILMLKMLIVHRLYDISDDQIEYQINDRLSFQQFLGSTIGNPVSDAKTIWKFRNLCGLKIPREIITVEWRN